MSKTTKEANKKKSKELISVNTSNPKKNTQSNIVASVKQKTSQVISKNKSAVSLEASTSKVAKVATSKKTPSKKIATKETTKTTKIKKQKIDVLEYYDLPYRYNKTVVKVLAQTPKTLFVYWDISDEDRKSYIKQYGKTFFENTKPVLIIHNTTMNYTFEIEINDFANCWYFNINDEKCEYLVELGRRQRNNNYLYITSSNRVESPNGHILFEKEQKVLYYRNVKTNETSSKDIANLEFIKYFGRIYNIYDMYKKIYKEEEILDASNNPTSSF